MMGQAKRRGTQEQRTQEARAKIEALRPDSLICNSCQHEITEIHEMPTRGIEGIDAAFAGLCPRCNSSTYALKGEPAAIADFFAFLEEDSGGPIEIGRQPIPAKIEAD
jgi:hypothetical protein